MQAKGFTLIECVLMISIVAIFAVFGIKGYRAVLTQMQLRQAVYHLTAMVAQAKMTALSRGKLLFICPLGQQPLQCGTVWSGGYWLGEETPHGVKRLSLISASPGVRLYWQGLPRRQALYFSPDGVRFGQNGHFVFCSSRFSGRVYFLNHAVYFYRAAKTEEARLLRQIC